MYHISLTVLLNLLSISLALGFIVPTDKSFQSEIPPNNKFTYQFIESDTVQIAVDEGWNLISLPLIVPDNRVAVLFPNSVSNAFHYDGSYKPSDTMEFGKGYWLKFADADTVSIAGSQVIKGTFAVELGWNIIGTITQPCYARRMITLPVNMICSDVYKWDSESGYVQTDSLVPGEGYWVKCSLPGHLILESGSTGSPLLSPENWSEEVNTALLLKWGSMTGAISYHLQVSKDPIFLRTISIDDPSLLDTTELLCQIEYGERFFWRVRANYVDSTSDWSVTWTFQTLSEPEPTADSLAIFMFVLGEPTGWFLLNPNTLEVVDSLITSYRWGEFVSSKMPIEFSPDGSIWYITFPGNSPVPDTLVAIDGRTKTIVKRIVSSSFRDQFVMDKNKKYLIQVPGPKLLFIDRNTFSVVDSVPFDQFWIIRTSPVSQTLYGLGFKEIGVFNIDSFRVDKIIAINDTACHDWRGYSDMEISPDEKNLFLTVSTAYLEGCWDGIFYHIDLMNDSVISSLPCGHYDLICVSPDGKYVYLSSPQDMFGEPYSWPWIWTIRRYDIGSRTMETYIDFLNFTGLPYGGGIAEQIILSPENRSLFLEHFGRTCDGISSCLKKIDIATKEILKTFNFKLNQQGYPTQQIGSLKFGKMVK